MYIVVGIYVDSEGKRSRKQELLWHSTPTSIGMCRYTFILVMFFFTVKYTASLIFWFSVKVILKFMMLIHVHGYKQFLSRK